MSYLDYNFTISYDDFITLSKRNPEIGSLIRGTKSELAFTLADIDPLCFQFIYVNYREKFNAHMLKLPFKVDEFYTWIMQFVFEMCRTFDLADPVQMYNTYLMHVRDALEHFGISTISVFEAEKELRRLGKNEGILISMAGLEVIPYYRPKEFYFALLGIEKQAPPTPDRSYVYVMYDSNTGYFKIGKSKTPFKRERTLQSQNPNYSILFYWERSRHLETELHQEFRKRRIRGEWFKLSVDDLFKVKEIVDGFDG